MLCITEDKVQDPKCMVIDALFCFFFVQSKLNILSGQHSDFLDTLPTNVVKHIGVLKDLQVSTF